MPPPPVTRRTALTLFAAAAGGGLTFAVSAANASTPAPRSVAPRGAAPFANPARFYLGSVQHEIGVATADAASGALSLDALVADSRSSFLALSPTAERLYSVIGDDGGRLDAFTLDEDGAVTGPLGSVGGLGDGPCHVAVHPAGGHVFSANYNDGTVAVVALLDDGAPGEVTQVVQHTGSGPNPGRQEGPHAHQVLPDPGGARLFAVDLGNDSVYAYAFDAEAGQLTEEHQSAMPPGSGPRHMVFHPGGETAYVLGELDSTLTTCGYDAATGALTPGAVASLLPDGADPGGNTAAEIVVSADGRFVYASNRGDDSIAIFSVDGADETEPRLVGHVDSGGATPRHISLGADDAHLYVANQSTGVVVVFARDAETGGLTPTGEPLPLPGVECVLPATSVLG
ncbi:beta-propeller fold lactonase family protein [Streptomyces sp. 3MP-14]|uniref:Beta-propeller fold lactonase family protein n=1 Tax=Streptomyces mimosae TaxID=2586635 RepID=A0A5N5ZXE3_9ACTN|nr:MULTISPECIES: lactonase family protein [Streptomyces]KAB8161197.1 beta-propeller fold lactonase family protein [Streptomyces mimosae]KAB8179008.1 beta-propeller fold lactonase family protein [Streptomyces sp. 3MP-14]